MLNKKCLLLGILIIYSVLLEVMANNSECGVLRLQQDRSAGARVIDSHCQSAGMLALGSMLQMGSGSRAWLETIPTVSSSPKFQMICQNESSSNINIKVSSPILPWIQPEESSVNCSNWVEERLECKENGQDKIALICAIALKKLTLASHAIQKNASVVMRNSRSKKQSIDLSGNDEDVINAIIVRDVEPKLTNCEQYFDREVAVDWTVGVNGRVIEAQTQPYLRQDNFAQCAINVIKNFTFPKFSRDVRIQSVFR